MSNMAKDVPRFLFINLSHMLSYPNLSNLLIRYVQFSTKHISEEMLDVRESGPILGPVKNQIPHKCLDIGIPDIGIWYSKFASQN